MAAAEPADLVVHARWILPMEPAGTVLEDHALVMRGGRVEAVLPSALAPSGAAARAVLRRPDHALLPGLVNAHTHAAMALMRSSGGGMTLDPWLHKRIWPLEKRLVDAEFVRDGTDIAIAEMLLGGTTCFADMYYFPEEGARAASSAGMRAVIGLQVMDMPTSWASTVDECLDKGLRLHDQYIGDPLITTMLALHSSSLASDSTLVRVRTLADQLDISMMIHLLESATERASETARTGTDPFGRLERAGMISDLLAAVHCVYVAPEEIARLAAVGASVVHCPVSNLKLGSGIAPLVAMREAGLNVALGTDGAASNDTLDMLSEARFAALLAGGVTRNAAAVPAAAALEMATLCGARALGLDDQIGSLVPGKSADVCCIDLSSPMTQPVLDVAEALLHAASRRSVSDVWVAGRHLVADGQLTRMDSLELARRAQGWQARVMSAHDGLARA